MTCQQSGCALDIFSSCINHCKKNLCLEHLIEHGDIFLRDFTNKLDRLNTSSCTLMKQANHAMTQIHQQRDDEIERINRMYDAEQQELRKQLTFAENASGLLQEKRQRLIDCKTDHVCHIAQHELEQIKSYTLELQNSLIKKAEKEEKQIINARVFPQANIAVPNSLKMFVCPLVRPDVFGITTKHNIRLDCDGALQSKFNLVKHFENFHRMLPEYAARLRDAVFENQSPDQTKLFSEHDLIRNEDYHYECPLTDPTNVFGARSSVNTLTHIPCLKKQIALPSMMNHFRLYHKMKHEMAKTIFNAMKNKSLHSNLILFEENERVGTAFRRK